MIEVLRLILIWRAFFIMFSFRNFDVSLCDINYATIPTKTSFVLPFSTLFLSSFFFPSFFLSSFNMSQWGPFKSAGVPQVQSLCCLTLLLWSKRSAPLTSNWNFTVLRIEAAVAPDRERILGEWFSGCHRKIVLKEPNIFSSNKLSLFYPVPDQHFQVLKSFPVVIASAMKGRWIKDISLASFSRRSFP